MENSIERSKGHKGYLKGKLFERNFTPRRGFLGILGRKKRSLEETLNFIVSEGFTKNREEAYEFIKKAKSKEGITIGAGEAFSFLVYLQLKEYSNNGKKSYTGRIGTYKRDD